MQPPSSFRTSLSFSAVAIACAMGAIACSASTKNTTNGGGGDSGAGSGGGDGGTGGVIVGSGGHTGTITETCGASTYASQVPGNVLVVLDKSGSMAGGDGVPDKWAPTVDAMKTMMGLASPDLGMGLLPFPEGNFSDPPVNCLPGFGDPMSPACQAYYADGGCEDVASMPVVPVTPLSMSQGAIVSWLDSHSPSGGTPTLTALKVAYAYMQTANLSGERFVLLVTDGEPNTHTPAMSIGGFSFPESNVKCGQLPDIEAVTAMAAAGSPKVRTFVIGSPGSEPASDFLSQLAINGETQKSPNCSAAAGDCHYQIGKANFQQELEMALADITGKLSECVFEIPDGENADPDYVNVELETNGMKTQLYKDTDHMDGWDYTDDTHTKVELFGPACEQFMAEAGAKVSIILGCKTIVK